MASDLGKIGQTLKGAYNSSTTYEILDVVTFNGSSYVSLKNNNTSLITDPSSWQLNASKGDVGQTGPIGPTGATGLTGPAGSNSQSFNTKGTVATYANLPSSGNVINDAYYNLADGKVYIYNGTAFPANGNGFIPQGTPALSRTWGVSDTGLTEGSTRLRNDGIYSIKSGQTSTSTPPESDTATWGLIGINWDTQYKDVLVNPTLEVGAIALSGATGSPTSSTVRGRTVSFLDIAYANQLELIGDMRMQNIFYYDASNVYISTQVINAKTFTPTVPLNATKFKLSFYHIVNTQTVTQAELNALVLNCTSANYTTLKNVIASSKSATVVSTDYSNLIIDLGKGVYKELGGIDVGTGADSPNNIRIRTSRIKLSSGTYSITQLSGYVISRVVFYKDGVYTGTFLSTPDFTIDNLTANEVRLVWSKTVSTDVITQAEVNAFTFSLIKQNANKLIQLEEQILSISSTSSTGSSWFTNGLMSSIGDSITFGFIPRNYVGYPGQLDSYAKQTAALLGMTWENKGISGSTLGQVSASDTTTRDPMINRYSSMSSSARVITFMGGTNDLRNISNIGTISDRVPETYYGALHILIQGLLNKYVYSQNLTLAKNVLIVGITPIKIYPDSVYNTKKMVDYVNAMKEVCAYYSIPCFDAYNLSGLTPSEFRTLQGTEVGYTDMYNPLITDGVHPTKEGNAIWARLFAGWLKTLVS